MKVGGNNILSEISPEIGNLDYKFEIFQIMGFHKKKPPASPQLQDTFVSFIKRLFQTEVLYL